MAALSLAIVFLPGILAAQEKKAANAPAPRFTFELSDGSSIIGTPRIQSLPIESSLGKMEVKLEQIQGVEVLDDHVTIRILLANGDKLTGKSVTSKFELQAIFGNVNVDLAQVRKLRRYGNLEQKLKEMQEKTGKTPEQTTLDNIRQIGLACKQYAVDNGDRFPNRFDQLWKDYLPKDSPVWRSPYDPNEQGESSYRLIPNLNESAESETILIEETVVHDGKRAVYYVGGHVKIIPSKE
jgi:hypothetical protein